MKQLLYIIKREIFVKIKSKSFYLFAFVAPILFLIPIIFGIFSKTEKGNFIDKNHVGIYSDGFLNDTTEYREIKFFELNSNAIEKLCSGQFNFDNYLGILDLHLIDINNMTSKTPIKYFINENDLVTGQNYVKDVESFINSELIYKYAQKMNLPDTVAYNLSNLKNVYPVIYKSNNVEKTKNTASTLAYMLGMLLYIMFILYNNNILKSVFEEKNNKLAEVLCIFVKPLNLMLGKIIGLGVASLLQLIIWIVVFLSYLKLIQWYDIHFIGNSALTSNFLSVDLSAISNMPVLNLCMYLPLFFTSGFLLNGAISTVIAIYSSGKNANYLMFFGNILNLLSVYFAMYVATSPDSPISNFLSYFPLFSYLTVPVLMPYGIPTLQILMSLLLLVFTIIGLIFFSGILYKKSIRQ